MLALLRSRSTSALEPVTSPYTMKYETASPFSIVERSSVESNAFTFSFCVDKKKSVVSHVIPERGSEALLQLNVLDDIESDDYRVGLLEVKPGEAK